MSSLTLAFVQCVKKGSQARIDGEMSFDDVRDFGAENLSQNSLPFLQMQVTKPFRFDTGITGVFHCNRSR
jgi:hypothetical protein